MVTFVFWPTLAEQARKLGKVSTRWATLIVARNLGTAMTILNNDNEHVTANKLNIDNSRRTISDRLPP